MDPKIVNSRSILIAVDESDNAGRAVSYVRDLLGGIPGFRVSLITIIAEPSEDYFTSENERREWIRDKNASVEDMLDGYRNMLIGSGFGPDEVKTYAVMKECTSIAECILAERKRLACGAVVIGRRGISKKEEFLFGSTSNKILHEAGDCAVWVIE